MKTFPRKKTAGFEKQSLSNSLISLTTKSAFTHAAEVKTLPHSTSSEACYLSLPLTFSNYFSGLNYASVLLHVYIHYFGA